MGIPSQRRLKSGDLLSIECEVAVNGYQADAAITVGVGSADSGSQQLADTAARALAAGLTAAQPGARLGDVSHAIERAASPIRADRVRRLLPPGAAVLHARLADPGTEKTASHRTD